MRFEDMKNEIPETPDFIHQMIQSEVKKQLHETKVVKLPVRKKWSPSRIAVVAAAGILATSTVAFAGTKLYHIFSEKQGSYGLTIGIKTDDKTGKITLPKEIHDVDIFARYIPEGMKWTDGYHLVYPDNSQPGGFSFSSAVLDQNDLEQVVQDENIVDSEERTFGEYEGIYLKYNNLFADGTFSQRIYLFCPDLYRVFTIFIGDDVTKEDAVKVAENLIFTENDTIMDTAQLPTWSEAVMPKAEEDYDGELTSVAVRKLPVYQIGDTFDLDVTGENTNGEYVDETISASVDSIQIADDLQLLEEDKIPEEWKNAVDDQGKLVKNVLSYVKSGDGIDSIDEVVDTKEVGQKLVYATVTYTNNSEEEIDHMLYMGALVRMKEENGTYQIYNPMEEPGEGYDHMIRDGVAYVGEMRYYSVSENYGNGRNYISVLKPGENIQVNMAWIVNEDDLENLYLNVNGDGSSSAFSDSMLKDGVVDIRQ